MNCNEKRRRKKTENQYDAFTRAVWRAASRIPRGRVTTYGAIAKAIGAPKAARAVGNALNASPGMPKVPCHRVVRADGKLGGFARGAKAKQRLLENEGLTVRKGKIVLVARGSRSHALPPAVLKRFSYFGKNLSRASRANP
jgi:O-6-methylguanine DNA methyltransferase